MSMTPEKAEEGKSMIGTLVGSYKITEQIGAGGMGAVYAAEHTLLGKQAAVKVLLPRMSVEKEIVQRFFNEAKATSRIQHPGIVEVYDYGHLENGDAYIVMELLEGENLRARLKRVDVLSPNNAIATARHIAGVLEVAHRHGIIHRDLKPDNIFLVPDAALPRGERAKVLDFGIAKLSGDDGDKFETKTGQILGTPLYMSPEQCKGAGKIDHRSDVYALGCLLYQMLCGRPPFLGEGSGEILAAQIHIAPSPIQNIEPSIPDVVAEVVMKMLEKDPNSRYQTMGEVIDALNSARPKNEENTEPSLASSSEFFNPGEDEDTQAMERISGGHPATAEVAQLGAHTLDSLSTPPKGNRQILWFGAIAACVAIAATLAVTLSGDGDSEQDKSAPVSVVDESEIPTDLPAVLPNTNLVVAKTPDAGPNDASLNTVSKKVVLRIDSNPSGAKVYRESDGVRLGETPLEVSLTRGRGHAVFLLKKTGYHRAEIELSTKEDVNSTTELLRRGSSKSGQSDSGANTGPDKTKPDSPPDETKPDSPPDGEKPDSSNEAGKDEALDPFAAASASASKPEEKTP